MWPLVVEERSAPSPAPVLAAVLHPAAAVEVAAVAEVVAVEDVEEDKYSVRIRGLSRHEAPQFA